MKLGIIGLPQTGKTTIFNALTRQHQPTTMSGKIEVRTAIIDVPDLRISQLAHVYHPKKVTYAKVEYADIAGLEHWARLALPGFGSQAAGDSVLAVAQNLAVASLHSK